MSSTIKVGDTIPEATFIHVAYQPDESLATCGIRTSSIHTQLIKIIPGVHPQLLGTGRLT